MIYKCIQLLFNIVDSNSFVVNIAITYVWGLAQSGWLDYVEKSEHAVTVFKLNETPEIIDFMETSPIEYQLFMKSGLAVTHPKSKYAVIPL